MSGLSDLAPRETADEVEIARLEQRRDEAIAEVTTRVRGYVKAQQFEPALRILDDALGRYPGDLVLDALRTAVDSTRRRHARLPDNVFRHRYSIWVLPLVGLALAIPFMLVHSPEKSARPVAHPQMKPTKDTAALENALMLAIQDRSWAEANLWVNRLVQLNPGDVRIQWWMDQIDEGSARDRKVADLRADALQAIMARNWNDADVKLALLRAAAPGDPDAAQLQRLLADGRKEKGIGKTEPVRGKKAVDTALSLPLKSAPVKSLPAPSVAEFAASPVVVERGKAAVIHWTVTNATAISIDHGVGPVHTTTGFETVNPTEKTTYTLSATGVGGTTAASVTILVTDLAPPPQPVAANLLTTLQPKTSERGAADGSATPLKTRIGAVAGWWVYVNPDGARKAPAISLEVHPDGTGDLRFEGPAKGSRAAVPIRRIHFSLTAWYGERLSGISSAHDYRVNLEPAGTALSVDWSAVKGKGRPAVSGSALLQRKSGGATSAGR